MQSIHQAVARGDVALVRRLIAQGADVNEFDLTGEWGDQPVSIAAGHGDLPMVKALIEAGAGRISFVSEAIAYGQAGVVAYWLTLGNDVNGPLDEEGFTPLMCAAASGDIRIMEMLLAHGADANALSRDGAAALHVAIRNSHTEAVALLWGQSCHAVRASAMSMGSRNWIE